MASAQYEGYATPEAPAPATTQGKMAHEQMMMSKEPHQVLAMAYHQNLATFAKSPHEQTMQASSVKSNSPALWWRRCDAVSTK